MQLLFRRNAVRAFSTSIPRASILFALNTLSNGRETLHFNQRSKLARVEHSPALKLIQSSEIDPFAEKERAETGWGQHVRSKTLAADLMQYEREHKLRRHEVLVDMSECRIQEGRTWRTMRQSQTLADDAMLANISWASPEDLEHYNIRMGELQRDLCATEYIRGQIIQRLQERGGEQGQSSLAGRLHARMRLDGNYALLLFLALVSLGVWTGVGDFRDPDRTFSERLQNVWDAWKVGGAFAPQSAAQLRQSTVGRSGSDSKSTLPADDTVVAERFPLPLNLDVATIEPRLINEHSILCSQHAKDCITLPATKNGWSGWFWKC